MPELVNRERQQNRPTAIQMKVVNELLGHLDNHKPIGPNGNHLRLLRDLVQEKERQILINQPDILL